MTAADVITTLALPPETEVDQRVPKKLLVEHGPPTAADKRQINYGIEELVWVAEREVRPPGAPTTIDPERAAADPGGWLLLGLTFAWRQRLAVAVVWHRRPHGRPS